MENLFLLIGKQAMFTSKCSQRGLTLIELIFAIVVIAITFAGAYQGFLYMLKIGVQPLIEKQAVQFAFSIFHLIEEGKLPQPKSDCQPPAASNDECRSLYIEKVIDLLPFYQEASYHQFAVFIQRQSMHIQKEPYYLWSLNLTDNRGHNFYFSKLLSHHEND